MVLLLLRTRTCDRFPYYLIDDTLIIRKGKKSNWMRKNTNIIIDPLSWPGKKTKKPAFRGAQVELDVIHDLGGASRCLISY